MTMSFSFEQRQEARESDVTITRRARVLAFRLAHGEAISLPSYDPVVEAMFRLMNEHPVPWRVDDGNARGAVPEVM